MEKILLKTNLHCDKCVNKIEPVFKGSSSIQDYEIDLDHPDNIVSLTGNELDLESLIKSFNEVGYDASVYNPTVETLTFPRQKFWLNKENWTRASFNTLNCLIGCSIGDFGMLIYLQAYHPNVSMLWQMILATIAGLFTSILLETIILKSRENFDWPLALKTAFSMSFISMIGMELAMNATDFMITGGKAAFNELKYWLALIPALVAGFLLPLPYNYYKLQKFNKACH